MWPPLLVSLALIAFSVVLFIAVRARSRRPLTPRQLATGLALVVVVGVLGIPVGMWMWWVSSSIGKP